MGKCPGILLKIKENNRIYRIVNERTLLYNQYKGKQSKKQNDVMQNEIV